MERQLDPKTFEEMLDRHETWLSSREKDGSQLVLRGAVVTGANLRERRLSRASLIGVSFSDCSLVDCQLGGGVFDGTVFSNCVLDGSRFSHARLTDCDFRECRCSGTVFGGAEYSKTVLQDCALHGANLAKAIFRASQIHVSLTDAFLDKAYFEDCDLRRCHFERAHLLKTHFHRCDLRQCNFSRSTLEAVALFDVAMAGCSGRPQVINRVLLQRVDLSSGRDGSDILDEEAALRFIEGLQP